MRRSEHRILTTHVGSLPRPPALRDLLVRLDRGEEALQRLVLEEARALHREVRAVELEHEPATHDQLVFLAHLAGEGRT